MNNNTTEFLRAAESGNGIGNGLDLLQSTVGLTPGITPIPYFLQQLENWHTSIPMRTQWVVVIQQYPELLNTEVIQNLERTFGRSTANGVDEAVAVLTSYPLNKITGCVLAQGVDIPNLQNLTSSQNKFFQDKQRGFIPGRISEGMDGYSNLTLQFRETNTSFADFVIRPWSILAGHFGFVARPPGDLRNVGTTVSIFQYSRTKAGVPQVPRKIWTFYNCFPISLSNKNLTYDTETMEMSSTQWVFSNYIVENNLHLGVDSIINNLLLSSRKNRLKGIGNSGQFEISPRV